MADIFDRLVDEAKPKKKDIFDRLPKADKHVPLEEYVSKIKPIEPERGIYPSFKRGLSASAIGRLMTLGDIPEEPLKDEGFLERLSATVGEVLADIPAMSVGAVLGGMAATPTGPIGASIGAGAGMFALPTLIKQTIFEYKDYIDKGNDITFGDFLERAARISKKTGVSAITGATVSQVGRLLPILARIPGGQKILKSKLGKGLAEGAAEVGALTGTQAALEGRLPTKEEVVENALLVGAFKVARKIPAKAKEVIRARAGGESIIDIGKAFIPQAAREKVLKYTPETIKDIGKYLESKQMTMEKKKYFKMLKEHVGEREAKFVESTFNWREKLAKYKKHAPITEKDLSDMIYYRQKTGNPNIPGDTFKSLSNRLSKNSKHFVDKVVDPHLKDSLKEWNANPITKNIEPRAGLEDVYLPGLYEYDPQKFARTSTDISRRFKAKNPFSNEKIFLNYMEAFQKAGLKPKYDNIVDMMQAYDRVMIKSLANTNLIKKIRDIEKSSGQKLIVNSNNKQAYKEAKSMGYVPFYDPFLRQYVTTGKDGKPRFHTTAAPALVDPNFADAFQGVFTKKAYSPESPFLKAYDNVSDVIRYGRVALSPFHYVALMESSFGALGPKGLRLPTIMEKGKLLRQNKEFMMDAAKHGLQLEKGILGLKQSKRVFEKLTDSALKVLPEKMPGVGILESGVKKLVKAQNYLFDTFHPNLKAYTWADYVNRDIAKRQKTGKFLSRSEKNAIKSDMAEFVNNIYGGQNWDTMQFANNPRTRKLLRRTIGYPDWTISAAKQAASALAPGLPGSLARKYWLKYIVGIGMGTGLLKFMFNGLVQTDKKDKSIYGIRFDFKNAVDKTVDDQPGTWFKFPLPDINVNIAGKEFNPGRDVKDTKLYTHFGKQMLEIGKYIRPLNQMFIKANPLIQMFLKQVTGFTPYQDDYFTVRGKYLAGKIKPWDATKEFTPERLISRGKTLLEDVVPFGFRALYEKGIAPFTFAGFGAVPISKGLTLFKAEPLIEKALRQNNIKELNRIIKALKENKFSDKSIKSRITRVRNSIK